MKKYIISLIFTIAVFSIAASYIGPTTLGQYMGDNNMWWGSHAVITVQDSLYANNLAIPSNGFASGYVGTSDSHGNFRWAAIPNPGIPAVDTLGFFGTGNQPVIVDSLYAGFGHMTLAVGRTYIVAPASTFGADTVTLPTGTSGQWINVTFRKAVTVVSYTGTNGGFCGLTAATAGQSKTYINHGGWWE